MATTQDTAAQRKLDLAKAEKAQHSITTKTTGAKNRIVAGKTLSMEAKCLLAVQSGKGYAAILSICKSKYAEKDSKTLIGKETLAQFIVRRAKVYFTIAQKHADLLRIKASKVKATTQVKNEEVVNG